MLNEFVRDVAVKYVEDYHAIQVVSEVIEKPLTVGVADPEL